MPSTNDQHDDPTANQPTEAVSGPVRYDGRIGARNSVIGAPDPYGDTMIAAADASTETSAPAAQPSRRWASQTAPRAIAISAAIGFPGV